ncbi:uncharacterized protein [Palaemon carinicauda]|uniref:uncharacterized protein n=1 Tax=Palaemon carinicauda TaxID=392227 RepID=UPI0035B5B0B9
MRLLLLSIVLYVGLESVDAACGGKFTESSGTFQSPNYPKNYPKKKKCTYKFKTGSPLTITCENFQLQNKNKRGKCLDFFKVSDSGETTTFCGTDGPVKFSTSTSNVKVIFKSNKKKQMNGFSCTYTSEQEENPELLTKALEMYSSNTCYNTEIRACGCSVTKDDSEFYMTTTGDRRIVVTNGIPNHDYETGQEVANPNRACKHEVYMAVPQNPTRGNTFNSYGLGPVGMATSGGFFYNHLSSPTGDIANVVEGESFDTCNGHSDPFCRYHYHLLPTCIAGDGSCEFVGYMRDGFPVYTYCRHETESRNLKSCYYLTSGDGTNAGHYTYDQTAYDNGECDLDMANGYTFSDDRGYGYIFTEDYPFIMAGYYGTELSDVCYLEDGSK